MKYEEGFNKNQQRLASATTSEGEGGDGYGNSTKGKSGCTVDGGVLQVGHEIEWAFSDLLSSEGGHLVATVEPDSGDNSSLELNDGFSCGDDSNFRDGKFVGCVTFFAQRSRVIVRLNRSENLFGSIPLLFPFGVAKGNIYRLPTITRGSALGENSVS